MRLAGLRAQIESTVAILEAQAKELAIVERRFTAGGVSELDLRNQQALVAETRASCLIALTGYGQPADECPPYSGRVQVGD